MEWALITHDFSLRYVAENNATGDAAALHDHRVVGRARGLDPAVGGDPRRLPHVRRRAVPQARHTTRSSRWRSITGTRRRAVLLRADARAGEPVPRALRRSPLDGTGPNPLLQNHVLMAFHPPILYLGYVGFTVPFMFAIAALVTGRFGEGWLADTRRATLVAWGFLTVGIILGAWWSYEVLGWGGFWAWDPVENASFLPVAHRDRVHPLGDRAGTPRHAAGLEPVARDRDVLPHDPRHVPHPFGRDRLGARVHRSPTSARGCSRSSASSPPPASGSSPGAATSCARPAASTRRCRASRRSSPTTCCSPGSRSSCCSAPCSRCIAEALQGRQLSVGEPYFDRMTTPIGLALLFLMAVAPALPWRADERRGAAQPPARPGVDRRSHDARRACSSARDGLAEIARLRPRRVRHRGHRAPVRARHPRPTTRARRVARRSRSVARRARTRVSTAVSSCTSAWC